MKCINPACNNNKIFSRGYCSSCYTRLRRNGSLTRKNVSNAGRCVIEGCPRDAFSKNLCSLHYQRGSHPLSITWKNMRMRHPGQYPEAWNDFDVFLADVGERPSPKHQLRRPNHELPWSTDNMKWVEPIGLSFKDERPAYAWKWHLRNKYGLSLEDYNAMMERQNGRCAISGVLFSEIYPGTGNPYKVCVDHDHRTGAIRGLVTDTCNKIIGMADDSIELLESAIAYLRSHAS